MPRKTTLFVPSITYDPQADAVAISLAPTGGGAAPLTRVLDPRHPDIRGDWVGPRLTAIEILGASAFFAPETLARFVAPITELTLAQAAKESKRSASTLRVQINQGRLPARKQGRDWLVKRSDLWNYLESLAPTGRPTADTRAPRRRRVRSPGVK